MSYRIVKTYPELKRFGRLRHRDQRKYIKTCSNEFVKCICDCANNIVKRIVPLKANQIDKLRRHRKSIRQLAVKRTPLKKKRQILQRGGFLHLLLPPVIGYLASKLIG